jgi:hypothetical protein
MAKFKEHLPSHDYREALECVREMKSLVQQLRDGNGFQQVAAYRGLCGWLAAYASTGKAPPQMILVMAEAYVEKREADLKLEAERQ